MTGRNRLSVFWLLFSVQYMYLTTQHLFSKTFWTILMTIWKWFLFCRADAVIDPWLKAFWEKALALYPLPVGQSLIKDEEPWVSFPVPRERKYQSRSEFYVSSLQTFYVFSSHFCRLPPRYTFHFLDNIIEQSSSRVPVQKNSGPPSSAHPFLARVVFNHRVTSPSHFQDVRHIEFDISGSDIEWVNL